MFEVFTLGAENPQLASSGDKPARISSDPRRDGLLRRYLFASDEKAAGDALNRLTIDGRRAAIGGMTPRERGLAEGIDTAKDWAPVVAANVGVAGAAGLVSYAAPELRPYLGGAAGVGFLAGAGIEVAVNTLARMEASFPWAAEAAKRIAASRVGKWLMMLSLSGGVGTAVGGLIDSYLMARGQAAAQPAAAGGEGFADHHPRPVDASAGQFDGSPLDERGEGVVVQPVPEVAAGNEIPHLPGEVIPPEDLMPQPGDAELIAQQQAEAARQAALDTAETSVGLTGQELAGGTIWGNELEFVKQLGVHHLEPTTNLLKNFSQVLAQSQPSTEIGPTDTAYVINRDVAGWAVRQLDTLYRMDPSAMEPWQKALWEIGRGLRSAGWQDLQAVMEEYVRSTINH